MNNHKVFLLPVVTFWCLNLFAQGSRPIQNQSTGMVKIIEIDRCGIAIVPFMKNNRIKLEIQYGMSWDKSGLSREQKSTGFVELDLQYSVRNSRSEIVWENQQREYLNPITNSRMTTQIYAAQQNRMLPLDDYIVECKVRNLQSKKSLKETYVFKQSGCSKHELYLSDIMMSSAVRPKGSSRVNSSFVKGDYVVVPYPFHTVNRGSPVFFYFEIDNLLKSAKLYSEYKVAYNLAGRSSEIIGSEYVQSAKTSSVQEFFSINLDNVKKGKYTLEIVVTDQVADIRKSSAIKLQLTD